MADGRYFFGDCVSDRAFSFTYRSDGTPIDMREETEALPGGSGLSTLSSFGEDGHGRLYVIGQDGVIVVMCPSRGERPQQLVPASDAAQGPRAHVSVADPCT